jgi:hypothetical protein
MQTGIEQKENLKLYNVLKKNNSILSCSRLFLAILGYSGLLRAYLRVFWVFLAVPEHFKLSQGILGLFLFLPVSDHHRPLRAIRGSSKPFLGCNKLFQNRMSRFRSPFQPISAHFGVV